ncbi:MAG: cytochrome b [Betaproteobacteria bacterium]|nr:cytochrome b [Betaproteobacteria bacterium]
MGLRNTAERYGSAARALHWSVAALVFSQIAGGSVLEELPRRTALRAFAFDAHESVGLAVLGLVAVRIAWRLVNVAPVATGHGWQRLAAALAHFALYALMVAVPVVGYAMVDANGFGVVFFGVKGPDLMAADKNLAKRLAEVHETLAWLLVALAALHVAAAGWHHCALRDGTLARMRRRRSS